MDARRMTARVVAILSAAAIAASIGLARRSEPLVAATLILAMVWGAVPQAIDAFFGRFRRPEPADGAHGSVTFVVQLDAEPADVALATVTAAAASGPTIVVATDPRAVALLGPLPVPVFVDRTVEEALNRAVIGLDTDAVLIVSARSFPDVQANAVAAGMIKDGAAWVVGRSRTFNRDGFAPLVREHLGTRLRTSARSAGLDLWEPDATVVSTTLLREWPLEPGRPWGAALRSWAAAGRTGREHEITLTMTAEPVDSLSYWSMSVQAKRRAVADVADAITTAHGRARWLAVGLLLRELDGYLLALWLLAPWLITTTRLSAFQSPPWMTVLLVATPALLRWAVGRHAHDLPLHPLDDALALAYDAPGSVLALPSAVTRRVTPTRVRLPGQVLILAGLVFAAVTLVPLFTTGTTAKRSTAVGLALTEMGLLWLLAMRVAFQRNWLRRTYRIRTRLPTRVGNSSGTMLDVSPSGLALQLQCTDSPDGGEVVVDVTLDDGSLLSAPGHIANRRRHGDLEVIGVRVQIPPGERSRWLSQVARCATSASHELGRGPRFAPAAPPPGSPTIRAAGRVLAALMILASTTALLALCLALVGFRPLIVRSASMTPTLHVGDVVLVEDVRAQDLSVGDIATLGNPANPQDTLTHRVRAIDQRGGLLVVTTHGDANTDDETFTIRPDALVGRVAWRIPRIGATIAWAGNPQTRRAVGATGGAVVVLGLMRAWSGPPRRHRNPGDSESKTRG